MHRCAATLLLCVLLASCGPTDSPVVVHAVDAPPDRLSEWGILLADRQALRLNDGVVAYDLNTPLFSDYALKLRTVWVPEDDQVTYDDTEEFDFPVGTIISKTFHYEKAADKTGAGTSVLVADRKATLGRRGELSLEDYLLIETRLLVRYAEGWRALPYVWDTSQSDAYLEVAGDLWQLELVGKDTSQRINYVVPDTNQCAGCHTPNHSTRELRPIGPKAWQLNRSYDYVTGPANQLDYWQQQLAGIPALLELPTDRPRPAIQTYHGGIERFNLSSELTAQLQIISKQSGVTLFMTLLAAFKVILARYSRSEDLLVGVPIAGRNQVELEQLIGFFVNMLVIRTDASGDPTFAELLQRVRTVMLNAYAHQEVPFEMLVGQLSPERSLSHSPRSAAKNRSPRGTWRAAATPPHSELGPTFELNRSLP